MFALLLVAGLALAVFGALIASGHYVERAGHGCVPDAASADHHQPPRASAADEARRSRRRGRRRTQRPRTVVITIKASRGDCWVNAHRGSPSGNSSRTRPCSKASTITLRGPRIWLQLGAAGNVDIAVNGRARPVPSARRPTGFVLG